MEKQYTKYIIGICVLIVVWGVFMVYRHNKRKRDTDTYTQKTYDQVTEAAKRAPRAGLTEVGLALANYYRDNHRYPPSLIQLYPKYLANKSLIVEIDWNYKPEGDDFYLSKAITLGDKIFVASIDKDLRPEAETSVMVAAPTLVPKPEQLRKPKEVASLMLEPSEEEPMDKDTLRLAREEFLKALRRRHMSVTSVSLLEGDEARIISTIQPEILSIEDADIASGLVAELSKRYLVWKDSKGVLGFSNIQYPDDEDRLSIHAIGRWYNVKIPAPEGQEPVETEIGTMKKEMHPETIAASFKGRYLVWKDRNGILGFGDGQYPEIEHVSALQDGAWVAVPRHLLAPETHVEEDQVLEKTKEPETLASAFSTEYLVWKDRRGTLGFGNVQYPDMDHLSVRQRNRWIALERPPVATETGVDRDRGRQKGKSLETIASEFSTQYLVWKDRNGTLGFGNGQYPEIKDLSHVHVDGSWEPVTH